MTVTSQRTIYGIAAQLAMSMGKEYTPLNNTTLNEKFKLLTEVTLEDTVYPKVGYYAIGVGGLDVIDGNTGYTHSKHSPVDAALFEHIPFVMRPLTADLTPEEKDHYRFRVIENINNIDYACYYLKCIPTIELRDYFYKISTVNEETILSIYKTDTDKLLNPKPKIRDINNLDITTSTYVTKIAKLKFDLTIAEMNDLMEVLALRDLANRHITEIGVVMGVDQVLEDSSYELTFAQVAYHVEVNMDLSIQLATNKSLVKAIELGGTEPLIV